MKPDKKTSGRSKSATKPAPPVIPPRKNKQGGISKWVLAAGAIFAAVAYVAYPHFAQKVSTDIAEYIPAGAPQVGRAPIRTVSIVMIAFNENPYIKRTIDSLMKTTPLEHLKEIIFVDDSSDPPASKVIDTLDNPYIKIVRNEVRQGLIKARMQGANASTGDLLVFLDAHIRAFPGWLEPMLENANLNYKRITFPLIPVLDEKTWEPMGRLAGINMVFDWKMDFIWLDESPEMRVPTMSGGLMAITREWYYESGEYDEGMLLWGGENVEQSMRTWLCGGEIIRSPRSVIGHMFRAQAPYAPNITQIHMNKARAVDVWFDDYASYYYRANPMDRGARQASKESLAARFALKEKLNCKPFQYFVDLFKDILEEKEIMPKHTFHIRNQETGNCLTVTTQKGPLEELPCDESDRAQVFIPDSWKRIRSGLFTDDCIAGDAVAGRILVRLEECSAHVAAQKDWIMDEKEHLLKKNDSYCVATRTDSDPPQATLRYCKKEKSHFEKHWIQPYNHALYK